MPTAIIRTVVLACAATCLVGTLATAQSGATAGTQGARAAAPHPLDGTWKLNLAKTTYDPPELAAKSSLVTFKVSGDVLTASLAIVDYLGRAVRSEYTVTFDGKEHPFKGTIDGQPTPNQDAISWKKIDERTYEIVNKLKGRVLTTQRIVIAADGKSRTTTITGTDAQGRAVRNVLFFERQ